MIETPQEHLGWFDRLKNSMQIENLMGRLNLSKHALLDMALFLGIGFLFGFLWKRFANYIIASLLFIVIVIILHQLEIVNVSINWVKIQECCGIIPAREDADMLATIWSWSKMNVFIIFSFIIGFCFGAKVS